MSTRLRPGDDPDLEQAIADLAPVFAKMLEAKAQLKKMGTSGALDDVARARSVVEDCVGRIQARAERIAVDPMGLRALLDVYTDLRGRQKRRPSRTMMQQALSARARAAAEKVDQLRAALAAAEATAKATAEAKRLYGGRAS